MKAVIVHGSNDSYGASRVLLDEVRILSSMGYRVTVAVPSDGPLAQYCDAIGAETVVDPNLLVLRRADLRDAIRVPRIPTYARDADLVVIWTLALSAYAPLLQRAKIPLYVAVHELLAGKVGIAFGRLLAAGRYPVTCCSAAVKSWLQDCGVAEDRLYVTYPIVDSEPRQRIFRSGSQSLKIGVVGRMNGHKGHLEMAEAISHSSLARRQLELILYGGPYPGQERFADEIRNVARKDPRITIIGEVTDVPDHLARLDLVACFPSRPEPFGLVPIEAWISGTRTIGYLDGGAAEVIPTVGGIGFPRSPGIEKFLELVLDNWAGLPPLPTAKDVLPKFSADERASTLSRVIELT
ncbi:glycosyltransferase family 4 protein [Rhodococcus ruber]